MAETDERSRGGGSGGRVFTNGAVMHPGTRRSVGAYAVWVDGGRAGSGARWTRTGRITNQTMELAGALAGLEAIDAAAEAAAAAACETREGAAGCEQPRGGASDSGGSGEEPATLYTSSHYVMNCMTRWLPRWEATGWVTKQRRPVQNGEIVRKMAEIVRRRPVRFVRVEEARCRFGSPEDRERDPVDDGMGRVWDMIVTASEASAPTGLTKRKDVRCVWNSLEGYSRHD
jgi:ribonuclease HI